MEVPVNPVVMKLYRDKLVVPDAPSFIETKSPIVPVMNLDPIKRTKCVSSTTAVSATGWKVVHTVPTGKNWYLRSLDSYQSGGTFTYQEIRITISGASCSIDQFTAATVEQTLLSGQTIYLPAGATVDIYVGAYTNPGDIVCRLLIEEEDAY